jgi:hypothetical protein
MRPGARSRSSRDSARSTLARTARPPTKRAGSGGRYAGGERRACVVVLEAVRALVNPVDARRGGRVVMPPISLQAVRKRFGGVE